jgi:hypothetical protein
MIERASGKGGGDNKDKGNDKDVFETIKAFEEKYIRSNINNLGRIW